MDLDFVEEILARIHDTRKRVYEQALYAIVWGDFDVDMITQRFLFLPRRNLDLPAETARRDTVAVHLAGNRKQLIHDLCQITPEINVTVPARLRSATKKVDRVGRSLP